MTRAYRRYDPRLKNLVIQSGAFNGDVNKTLFWFNTPNPALGSAIPKNLILRGRYKKVLDFVLASRSEV